MLQRFRDYKKFRRRVESSLAKQGYVFNSVMLRNGGRAAVFWFKGFDYSLHLRSALLRGRRFEVGDKTFSGSFVRQNPEEINRILQRGSAV